MNSKVITIKFRALKLILTLVLACSFIMIIGGVSGFGRVRAGSITITSAAQFAEYSQNYSASNQFDEITISIGSGDEIINEDFVSLGTSDYPFAGKISVPTGGYNAFRLYNCPLFDYVSTSMEVTGLGVLNIERVITQETPGMGGALFANHVVGSDPAKWIISLTNYTSSAENVSNASSFAGLIGEIDDNVTVTVNFTNTSSLNVSGSGNIGYICGTLGAGATLNVTTAGSGTRTVSGTGNVGGLVGEMAEGSTLVLQSANNTGVTSVSTSGGYAGGIVGKVNNVTSGTGISLDGVTDYEVSANVTGTTGAGGLFGYYKNSIADETFTLASTYRIASGMRISSTGSTGGVFGMLENNGASLTFSGNASGGEVLSVNLPSGSSRGGICGTYKTNALANTFTINDTSPTVNASGDNSGGLIGLVSDNAAYILIPGASVTVSSGTLGGGLIGSIGDTGTFVDVSGTVAISGSCDAGLVGTMSDGVLRIKGITDLSSFTAYANNSGQIVKKRDRALIYALGSGSDYSAGNGWTIKRNLQNAVDDVFSWGQVLRVDGTTLAEGDLFTVDTSSHTVTLKGAVTQMSNITQFALTALNIQLNTTKTYPAIGALQFTSGSANQNDTLLSGTLTLENDINLANTGLTGLTRDNGKNPEFKGTFDGKNHTLTFATGEKYGVKSDGSALGADSKQGNIYNHEYNGLFAKTNNAVFKDVTLSGLFMIHQKSSSEANKIEIKMKLGGLSAYSKGTLSIDNVTADFTLDFITEVDYELHFGGAVGDVGDANLNVTVTNSNFRPVVRDNTGSSPSGSNSTFVGGVIGYFAPASTQSVSIIDSTVGLDYNKTTTNTKRMSYFGSAIARIGSQTYSSENRSVTLNNVTVDIDAAGTAASSKFGGILGTDWLSADVSITGLTVSHANIKANASANFGGLVHTATGHWNVNSIDLTADEVNFNYPTSSSSSFGFIANKTAASDVALFLEVNNANFNISALKFVNDGGTELTSGVFASNKFDEIVATSIATGSDIVSNGQSVISITTTGNLINTTSGDVNIYENITNYGSNNHNINLSTRYYYNIEYAREHTSTPKYNFLTWTVGKYAHSSISALFAASSAFSGDLDMTGLSYYPIDLTANVSFSNATLKLDNKLMETWVNGVDSRTTRSNTNQHYLMHTAAFRNVTSGITISGLTIQGNVPKMSDGFCGFIVAGKFGGNETGDPTVFNASNVTFDGAYIITNTGANITTSIYAPLFVNKIGKRTAFTVSGARQSTSAYSSFAAGSQYAGSSLIGDVGDESARTINLTFTGLTFDGRSTASSIGNMDTTYGTTRSIFSRATILNSFKYAGECTGTYNYEDTEDWENSSSAIHNVTYGQEITTSVENSNKQHKYYSSTVYTHPTSYPSASAYDFSTGFLPYVYNDDQVNHLTAYDPENNKHELSVNVTYSTAIEGFGKYDQPYIIDSGDKLNIISKIIKGDDVGNTVEIYLPGDLTSFNYTSLGYGEYLYNFGTSTFVSSGGGANQTNANVRKYLAGAYYVIDGIDENTLSHIDITLPSDYESLGQTTDPQYAFRGIIIGGRDGTKKIVNTSPNPLVYTSHGCVIKDLTIEIDSSSAVSLAAPTGSAKFDYSGGIATYGAVIGQIFGGDTIIDNVQVTFANVSFSITGADSTHFERLVPIGGYVGTLVNGGLIFRNMTASNVGLTADKYSNVANAGYLYVNPIIGRVIAGYAFHETSTYAVTSASIPNGTKNYTIPDLSLSAGKLTITNSSSTYTINVPDGQAMYVLGAIVNSGAASAAYNASTEQAYADLKVSNVEYFWQAYREHTTVRGGASYSGVGTSSGDDYTAACNDQYTSTRVKVPYIIRAYSNKTGNVYFARTISSRDNNIINITGDCDVAAGFRGIGSIYLDNDSVRLRISGMNGNSNTITLHMDYREYIPNSEKYKADTTNKTSNNRGAFYTAFNSGFGLFNRLNKKSNNYITDFTISGSVLYDVFDISSGSAIDDTWNNISALSILNVGGLAGIVINNNNDFNLNVSNVHLNNLTIEGPKYAGGLIGLFYISASSNVARNIKECDANNLTVIGGKTAAGLIGYLGLNDNNNSNQSTLVIEGSNSKSSFTNMTITVKGPIDCPPTTDYANERLSPSAAGLIGYADVGYRDKYILNVSKIIISDSTFSFSKLDNARGNSLYNTIAYSGGIIGGIRGHHTAIHDVDITHVGMSGDVVGGLIGYSLQPRQITKFDIYNVTIDGSKPDNPNSTMSAKYYVGGLIGWQLTKDNNKVNVSYYNNALSNYNLISTGNSGAVGGLIGYADVSNTAKVKIIFYNTIISDCVLNASYSSAGNGDIKGVGSLLGAIRENQTNGHYYGHNILIDGVSLVCDCDANVGAIVGNNINKGAVIKIVGISTDITTTRTLGTGEYKNNGYVVYADYNAVQSNSAFSGIKDTTTDNDSNGTPDDTYTNVTSASPYVTANPSITVEGKLITSDGVAADVASLPINSIISDGTTGKYKYSASAYYTGSSSDTNLSAFTPGKLQMFKSEVTEFEGSDFPVLILDTTEKDDSHKLINSYLRLLTNTQLNFGDRTDSRFDVVIYNMKYEGGSFVAYTGSRDKTKAASLKLSSGADGKFYMLNNAIDSGKVQFSLIDVRFYDPADESKVAYHLYVPVFVKKVLSYQFDIVIKTGTTYLESVYLPFSGVQHELIENVGTPVTACFKYTYSRTASEWAEAINAGENISRNYAKSLAFKKPNESSILKDYPSGTILVLVDKQTGRPYYSTWGAAFSAGTLTEGTLDLSAFKSVMTKNGDSVTFSGDSFEPMKLEQMMTLIATQDDDGTLIIDGTITVKNGKAYRSATSAELANGSVQKYTISEDTVTENNSTGTYVNCDSEIVVIIGNDAYRYAEEGEEGTKYTVSVTAIQGDDDPTKKIEESYYLSIFTEMTDGYDLFHYYNISSPAKFEDDNNPAKIEDTGDNTSYNLIMGKIFDHGDFQISSLSVEDSTPHNVQLMTDTNNVLRITASAQMGVASSLGSTLKGEMATKMGYTPVYQSFLVYLTRKEGNGMIKAIVGSPTVEGVYGIDVDLTDDVKAEEIIGYSDMQVTQNAAEFVTGNLSSQFATGDTFGINATFTFTYSAVGIPTQFPGRGTMPENRDNGVAVSGSSNIGFSPSTTAYSKNSVGADETPAKWYYSSVKPEVATLDLIPINGEGMFDFTALGINARNFDASNINTAMIAGKTYAVSAEFRLLAEINAEPIWAQISDYTSAVIEMTLAQKRSDGTYGGNLDISDYITGITVGDSDAAHSGTQFTVTVSRSDLLDDGSLSSKIILPWLHFTVKTGKPFEDDGLTYGNYRVTVSVHLRNETGDLAVSNVTNYVIYTNAKVIPEFILTE